MALESITATPQELRLLPTSESNKIKKGALTGSRVSLMTSPSYINSLIPKILKNQRNQIPKIKTVF